MKLTHTQTAVLEAAAQNEGRVSEFPESVKGGARVAVLKGLVARDLAAPEGDDHVLTAAGYAAIGRERPAAAEAKPRRSRQNTKKAALLDLLRRPEGATLEQLVEATGWQPHSVRGALSTLGKEVDLSSEKADGVRTYRTAATA
ncbi:MAG: DUF3489 domain-containing protein [Nitrospirota bacterium]|nr:DUF3489 domain-containing protein [Nitrospirota bacterium]